MNKMIRFLFVLFFLAGFVALGKNGTAWADKLKIGASPQVASGQGDLLPRLEGTVVTTPTQVQTIGPGTFTVGSIATWILNWVEANNAYTATVVNPKELPQNVPGNLLTSPIKLTVEIGKTLGVQQKVCFPVPPGKKGLAHHWNGKVWVNTELAKNGQACVTVPSINPNPTYVALVEVK